MTMSFDLAAGDEVPLREAATVVLVRDGDEGIEVFMLKRNLKSDFVGGAYVFPGGAVDPEDATIGLDHLCDGRTDLDASERLGLGSGGLSYWVAAIRESFEEAGLLLAYDRAGGFVDLDRAPDSRWVEHRRAVDAGERLLVDVCREEELRLAVGGMHYFSHWITPEGAPRRYDTRFFVAAAPPDQTPVHDDREVVANEWLRPSDGLRRALAGELTMLPPTIASLRAVDRFESTADLLSAAAAIGEVPRILPRVVAVDGRIHILMPGDPGYDGEEIGAADLTDRHADPDDTTTGFGLIDSGVDRP